MKIYLVGGAVRDKLLNYPSIENDWVVVGSSEKAMLEQGFNSVGKDFPVFLHPQTKEEYALARKERKVAAGYGGFDFDTDSKVSLEEDLLRRDLTINAIAEDENGKLIDPYGGIDDINNKLLRHVSPAFTEDPLRVLRVARFAARYHHLGFSVADETLALMQEISASSELDALVAERIWQEFQKALGEPNPEIFFEVLSSCGALERLWPDLAQHKESALFQLRQATFLTSRNKNLNAKQCRFACLLQSLEAEQILHLCAAIKCPKTWQELASQLKQQLTVISASLHFNAQELFQVLKDSDALRRSDRFDDLLLCCKACYRSQTGKTLDNFVQAYQLKLALKIIANINAKDLIKQGLKGPEVGRALEEKRIEALEELMQALNN
ncbi:hypothetical protein [Agaribacterium sp. ZY112]|uniref:hypothetical protein n=1 Tax=Agaribacterium sp. ZY112 TaxID=3233574 RepID=UPI003523B72E